MKKKKKKRENTRKAMSNDQTHAMVEWLGTQSTVAEYIR